MDTAKQMQMAFMMEEGGLTDDGTTMDPVSGNEVPPGSMAEEVRDDVPAQLSEGEYVVPADVVRFYGVKFFEDLRTEAKRGLMDMEANGRIGGEPVAMTMDNQASGDLTPEELAALEQITGMAVGGMVPQPTQSTNPYLQQQQMYQQPAPVAMGNTGQYNKGGQVLYAAPGTDVSTGTGITNPVTNQESDIDPYQPQFGTQQASMFSPGYLIDQTLGTTATPVHTVIMYGPNGEVETLTLPAQQARYEELLELGYSETQIQTTTETTVGQQDEGEPTKTQVRPEPIDVDSIKPEDLSKTAKGLGVMTNIATAIASSAGLPVAAFINTAAVAQYNDIVDRMDDLGINEEGLKKKGSIFGGESSLYENLADTSGDGNVNFGDTWLGDLLGFDGEAGVQGDNLRDSFGGSRRTGGDDDDDGGSPAVTPSAEPETEPEVDTTITDTSSAAGVAESSGMTGGAALDEKYGITGLNQGGIVKRPNKKKKK
jgi:hypothetical protein